ncbi:hypothetical protein PARPLA_03276 [Rhodobacteraceae bacterium THAF1]|uniref:hypothetical protein n=1 Tax=Palleronia sp. THAF1 TaxID=2587842 RepID=UPI000F3C52FA|nr:hypothetical protein [Palleronia sp. THAF1]QFU08750.1 hypothetical protein FIU81_08705 [Palleronia sp. THAF1]VDC31271.1 hypothetical protein PARPLA_03276 [Rhodobacteraceae bacterium THAF1]
MEFRWIGLAVALLSAMPASAQDAPRETATGGGVSVELNAATAASSGGCTLSFLVTNGTDVDLESVVYETVLFDASGQVDRLTLFDFGALPQDRPRVRQFTMPDRACSDYGQILFNGAATCDGAEGARDVCGTGLHLTSRADIEVTG